MDECSATYRDTECSHQHHCVKDDDHNYIFSNEEDDWHVCTCGKVWR